MYFNKAAAILKENKSKKKKRKKSKPSIQVSLMCTANSSHQTRTLASSILFIEVRMLAMASGTLKE